MPMRCPTARMNQYAAWLMIRRRAAAAGITAPLERAEEKRVLLARHHADEATEPNPGLECVGAGERRAEQRQETIEEAVVLNDDSAPSPDRARLRAKQLVDEAMPHGIQPGRLARRAQDFGEAFRHVGPPIRPSYGLLHAARPRWYVSKRSAQLTVRTGDALDYALFATAQLDNVAIGVRRATNNEICPLSQS